MVGTVSEGTDNHVILVVVGALLAGMLALVLCSVMPVQAAVPIRLQVIPYQGNKQAKPVLPVLLPPPPMINVKAQPSKRRPVQSRGWNSDDDFDWLMD